MTVWDARSGRLLATLSGHTAEVNAAVFSPYGSRIVTASADRTAKIYSDDFAELLKRAKQ
jgi:WD40 repeat protein